MKCKRIFKVVSALALTVALMVSTGVVSFAAEYTTTTTYINQNTIEVTSVASGLEKGDMATYVAYNNGSFSEENAVYIDQATANGTDNVVFTYQTDSDNVKATVKFGGSTEDSAQEAEIEGWTIYVQVDDGEAEKQTIAKKADEYSDTYLVREIEAVIPQGAAIDAVELNDEAIDVWYAKDGSVFVCTPTIKDGDTIVIKTKEAAAEVKIGTVKAEVGKITAFAKATCAQDADYGIIVGTSDIASATTYADWNTAENYETPVKLPALGMGDDGGFCVEVEDTAIVAGTYNVAAYAGDAVTEAVTKTIE